MKLISPQPNQMFRLAGSGNSYFSNEHRIIDAPDNPDDYPVLRSLGCVDAPYEGPDPAPIMPPVEPVSMSVVEPEPAPEHE